VARLLLGDLVKLETGQEGIVEDIGWRITKVRMSTDDLIIIPNVKLSQSILVKHLSAESKASFQGSSNHENRASSPVARESSHPLNTAERNVSFLI